MERGKIMNKLMKILAFIVLVAMATMFTGAVSAVSPAGSSGGNVKLVNSASEDDNIDWDRIEYGCPSQGDNCSGTAVEGDDIVEYAGTVHTLTNVQYKDMWKRITKWQAKNPGKIPNYVTISDMKVGVDRITKDQFLDMKKRWDAWKKAHKNQEPSKIGIEGPVSGSNQVLSGSIQKAVMGAVGSFKSFTGFYNLCKNRHYAYYFNDKYTRSQEIKRLRDRSGLNCVDSAQLGHDLAIEMGYSVKYQRTLCRKSDGTLVGHILLKIKGKEFGSWTIVDLAACLDRGKPLGKYWGRPPYDINIPWLNLDDGKM